jgi:hypothetical protein
MTDVKRWVDDGAPEPVQKLLAAARDERPGEAGIQRTLVAIGVGSAVATGASHAAGGAGAATLAKSATGASTLAIMTKWGAIGAVGAMTTFGAVELTTNVLTPKTAPAVVSPSKPADNGTSAARRSAAVSPGTKEIAEPAWDEAEQVVTPPPEAAHAARATPPAGVDRPASERTESAAESERILEEVRAIDRARSVLARGDGRGTLEALDSYRSGFSERRFEPEALYLRMEALDRLGDSAGAKAAAERLLASFPNAPQAARAHVVAGR